MIAVLDTETHEEYIEALDFIISTESSTNIKTWTRHKKFKHIAAGLHRGLSSIPPMLFDAVRKNTNGTEQSHHKVNTWGRKLTLLQAIMNSFARDKQDMDEYLARDNFGIRSRNHPGTIEASMLQWMQQNNKRHQQAYEDIISRQDSVSEYDTAPNTPRCSTTGAPVSRRAPPSLRSCTPFTTRGRSSARSSAPRQSLHRTASENHLQESRSSTVQHLEDELREAQLHAQLLETKIANRKRQQELDDLDKQSSKRRLNIYIYLFIIPSHQ